jgi:cytidylate kinase
MPPGLVADGRDMGTVVFPDAALKLFLIASPEERARRRAKQLSQLGLDANVRQLTAGIRARDERDRTRRVAPLQPAEDARVVDSTTLDIPGVLQQVRTLAAERGLTGRGMGTRS